MPISLLGLRLAARVQCKDPHAKPRARRAIAWPIRPPPTRPIVLPCTKPPSRWRDCAPGNFPARTMLVAFDHAARHREHQPEMDVGGRLRHDRRHHRDHECRAWSLPPRRYWTGVIDSPRLRAVSDWRRSPRDRSCRAAGRTECRPCAPPRSAWLGDDLAVVGKDLDVGDRAQALRARCRAIGWVTKTRGFVLTAATARCRRRRRPRIARRRESCGWRRARRAPSECRARAPATPCARSSRRVRPPRRQPAAGCG